MYRCLLVFIFFTFFLPGIGYSQKQDEFSLRDCIEYALENSYQQKSYALEVREREAEIKQKQTDFLPQVNGYIDYLNYFSDLPTYIFPPAEGSVLSGGSSEGFYPVELGLPQNMNIGLKVNQVLYDQDFFISGRFRDNLSEINQLNLTQTQQEIIYNISKTFYQAASLKSQLNLFDYNFERLDKIEKMLNAQIRNGFAKESEKSRVLINRSKLITGKNKVESGFEQLLGYLKLQMGMPVEKELEVSVDDIDLEQRTIPDSMNTNENIKLQLLDSRLEINELEEQKVRNKYYPTLNAFAQFRFQAQRDAFNFFSGDESWYLINLFGIRLDIPIVHGGEKRRQLDLMEIKNSRMELDRVRLTENLKIQYLSAKNELENSIEAENLQKKNVELTKQVYEQTSALFTEGLAMFNELLEAEAGYRDMQSEYITSMYNRKLAELEYLNATGHLMKIID